MRKGLWKGSTIRLKVLRRLLVLETLVFPTSSSACFSTGLLLCLVDLDRGVPLPPVELVVDAFLTGPMELGS